MAALAIGAAAVAVVAALVLLDALGWDGHRAATFARLRARVSRKPASQVNTISGLTTLAARIERLHALKEAGFLSDAECARQELALLAEVPEI